MKISIVDSGAQGYLLKDAKPNELLNAFAQFIAVSSIFPRRGSKLVQRLSNPELSERELEVLGLMAQGMSNLTLLLPLSVKVLLNPTLIEF